MRKRTRACSRDAGMNNAWSAVDALQGSARRLTSPSMIASMAETLDEMAEEFDLLGDPTDPERYRHVIDLGRQLAPLTDVERSEANKVRGCASQVWLVTERDGDVLRFRGDSDAHIVRGLVAILLGLYSGRPPADILAFDAKAAFARLGLAGALSQQRSNGLFSMVERIRRDAAAIA